VLELSEDDAKQEIEKLIRGDTASSLVLRRCETCNISVKNLMAGYRIYLDRKKRKFLHMGAG
jgi:hypothetical protein